jgi:RimJ/RimL family protein N-acetyltransferase
MTTVKLPTSAEWNTSFCFPLDYDRLQDERIALIPFVPSEHLPSLMEAFPPQALYLPFDFTPESFLEWTKPIFGDGDTNILLAVIDKATSKFAGTMGMFYTSRRDFSTEFGPVITIPAFQKTYVSTHAVGVLLKHCLEIPSRGGIGMRRIQWQAHPLNAASLRLAERMGFIFEGVVRWSFVLPEGRQGEQALEPREGDPVGRPGRHSKLLSLCWDDWENGARERVETLMARK